MVRRLAHRGLRRPGKPVSLRDFYVKKNSNTKKSHKKERISFPCADGSLKLSDLLGLTCGERPAGGNLEQNEKAEEVEAFFLYM